MRLIPSLLVSLGLIASTISAAPAADLSAPLVSDSRIKTFVYNENEVYPILTQYGYQTSIEFSKSEEIQTISVGDRVAWQIIPAGRRVFIQTLQDDMRTNMTVVTDRRTYQFGLKSAANAKGQENRLVYVARFYYPDDIENQQMPVVAPISAPAAQMPSVMSAPSAQQAPVTPVFANSAPQGGDVNYNYTFSGDDGLAPVKVYDDGIATYFQFRQGLSPRIMLIAADGKEINIPISRQDDVLVADAIGSKFSVRNGSQVVCVFNEQLQAK